MRNLVLFITVMAFQTCQKRSVCIDQSKINPEAMCIQVYDPVCGCDGKTYGNSCQAETSGVTAYTKGACPG